MKKFLSVVLSFTIGFTGCIFPFSAKAADFNGTWAEKTIQKYMQTGMVHGDVNGDFRPNDYITRAELVAMINRFWEIENVQDNNFIDLSTGNWYYTDIIAAVANGYLSGYADGTIRPEQNVSRLETCVLLQRASGISAPIDENQDFGEEVPDWAKYAVSVLYVRDILNGYEDASLRLHTPVTRAEALVMIDTLYQQMFAQQEEQIDFQDPKRSVFFSDFEWDAVGDMPDDWYTETLDVVGVENQDYNNYVCIQKIDKTDNVQFTRYFDPMTGVVSFEYDVMSRETQGVKYLPAFWVEKERGDFITNIYMQNGNFMAYNGSIAVQFGTFDPEVWYHIRVDMDMDTKEYDVYIDDILVANKLKFRFSSAGNVGKISFSIPSGETGTLCIDNVEAYPSKRTEEALQQEPIFSAGATEIDFQEEELGISPKGWTIEKTAASVTVEQSEETPNKYLVMRKDQAVASGYDRATKVFDSPLSGQVQIGFRFKVDMVPTAWKAITISDHKIIFAVTGSQIAVQNSSGGLIQVYNGITANKWYSIKVIANTTTAKFDVYVNGVLCKEDLAFRATTSALTNFFITMDYNSYGTLFIDDLRAQTISGEETEIEVPGFDPESTVDTPQMWDWMKQYQKIPEGTVIQAEELQMSNMKTVEHSAATNGKAATLDEEGTGTLQYVFDGPDGYYSMKVGYIEEPQKADTVFRIYQNNQELDYWFGQYDDGQMHIRDVKNSWYFKQGDVLTLESYSGKEPAIYDFIVFDEAIQTDFERGYLVEDTFLAPENFKRSSWEMSEKGGAVRLLWNGGRSFDLLDDSESEHVWAKRRFLKQEHELTSELKFKIPVYAENISISYRNGEQPLLSINTENGIIVCKNQLGQSIPLTDTVNPDTTYAIKTQFEGQTAQIFMHGLEEPIQIDLGTPVILDNLYIETPKKEKAHILFTMVDVYCGYLVNEKFKIYEPEDQPFDWILSENVTVQTKANSNLTDQRSLVMNKNAKAQKEFAAQSGPLTASFEVLFSENGSFIAEVGDVRIQTDGTNIVSSYNGQSMILWEKPMKNQYYNVRVVLEPEKQTAKIYVNQMQKAEYSYKGGTIDNILFSTGSAQTVIDDVLISCEGEYVTTVPEPVKADTGDYIMGMQACDLWHEGGQFGWESVRPYDNRTPLAGYYDENNLEVADWEIKWMLEHGISLYLPCWYRPSSGSPIKTPDNSWRLNNAFLNSAYIDQIDFAVVFENSGRVSGPEDFIEHIVKYWIEHYFKHPSYMVIDNKPLICIWNPNMLASDLGGDDINAQTFEKIEELLIEEGFDGAIFVGYTDVSDQAIAETMVKRGYDYSYIYGFGDFSDIASQLNVMNKQRETGVMDAIPILSQGWGNEAWGLSVRKYNLPLDDFRRGLEWLKNDYMPSVGEESLAGRMIMFGNWNEIAEGHFFVPSRISGFGYLDQIREVFSDAPIEHVDEIPEKTYDYMSPILW